MCPYCSETALPGLKCELCDEFQTNAKDLLTTAWFLQHSIVTETAAITRMVEIHGQALSLQSNESSGMQVLQIERDRQVQEHENMTHIADELSVMYATELKEIERSLLLLTEEASLYGVDVRNPYSIEETTVAPSDSEVCNDP